MILWARKVKYLLLTRNSGKRQVQSLHLLDHVQIFELLALRGAEQREIPAVEAFFFLVFGTISMHGERFLLRFALQHGPRAGLAGIPAGAGVSVDENVWLN